MCVYIYINIYTEREREYVERDSCYISMVMYGDCVYVMVLFNGVLDLQYLTRVYSCGPRPAGENVLGWSVEETSLFFRVATG